MPCNRKQEREEVDVAVGCFERLWETIHQKTTVLYEKHNKDPGLNV